MTKSDFETNRLYNVITLNLESRVQMSSLMRKPTIGLPNMSDTNRTVQAQMARGWKFFI